MPMHLRPTHSPWRYPWRRFSVRTGARAALRGGFSQTILSPQNSERRKGASQARHRPRPVCSQYQLIVLLQTAYV